jgi:hypothetical protein
MSKFSIILAFLLPFNSNIFAQQLPLFNSTPIDTLRYQQIEGTPYLYQDWKLATIIGRDSTINRNVRLNYNGYAKKFEVRQPRGIVTLDENLYEKISVVIDPIDSTRQEWFIRGLHYEIALELTNVLYDSEIKLIREFSVRVAENSYEIPALTITEYKFVPSKQYYILYKSKLQPIKLTKKSIGKVLGDKVLVTTLVNENKLDLTSKDDLITLLSMFEAKLRLPLQK